MKKVRLVENEHGRRLHLGSYFTDLNESDYQDLIEIFSKATPQPVGMDWDAAEKEYDRHKNIAGILEEDMPSIFDWLKTNYPSSSPGYSKDDMIGFVDWIKETGFTFENKRWRTVRWKYRHLPACSNIELLELYLTKDKQPTL